MPRTKHTGTSRRDGPRVHRPRRDFTEPVRQLPRLAGDADPHRRRRDADRDERIAKRPVRRIAQIVRALNQIEQQPEHVAERRRSFPRPSSSRRAPDRARDRHQQDAGGAGSRPGPSAPRAGSDPPETPPARSAGRRPSRQSRCPLPIARRTAHIMRHHQLLRPPLEDEQRPICDTTCPS